MEQMNLEEYVECILNEQIYPLSSHQRICQAIQNKIDKQNHSLFGMDRLLQNLMNRYFRPAAQGYDVKKRIIILIGPPASGKSSLVRLIKEALTDFSKTDQGAVFRIEQCPLHENPLLALPENIRRKITEKTGHIIQGKLSSRNQYRMREEWENEWRKIPVERYFISENERRSIGTFVPGDPYTQELSDLIGEVDFSTITKYGSVSHPYAYRYDGELQVGNQGMLEMQEIFKASSKLLYPLLSLAEEGTYKIPRQAMIHSDVVVIGHSNPEDFKVMLGSPDMLPLLSRMVIQKVPYNLELDEEIKLYQSKLHKSDLERIQPFALETLAATSLYTRVERSAQYSVTRMEKVQIYNGNESLKQSLQNEFTQEGMIGLPPRMVYHVLSIAASQGQVITAEGLLGILEGEINDDLRLSLAEKEQFILAVQQGREFFNEKVKRLFLKMFMELEPTYIEVFVQSFFADDDETCRILDQKEEQQFKKLLYELRIEEVSFANLPHKLQHQFSQAAAEKFFKELNHPHQWFQNKMLPKLSEIDLGIKTALEKMIEKLALK